MELPYSTEVYRAAMGAYAERWVPAAPAAFIVASVVFYGAWRWETDVARRACGALVGLLCVWVGWAHQVDMMADFDFMAPVYGWAWIAHGSAMAALFLGDAVRFEPGAGFAAGFAVGALGVIAYPAATILSGATGGQADWAGSAPGPTALVVAGLLVAARGRWSAVLWIMPLAWAGVASMTGYLLATWPPYLATFGILAALVARIRSR